MVRAVRRRRSRSIVATLTLSALLAVSLSTAAHDGSDDPLCAPEASTSAAGPQRLSAARGVPRHAEHCVLCHAAQVVRAQHSTTHHTPHQVVAAPFVARPDTRVMSIVSADRPARAPPRA